MFLGDSQLFDMFVVLAMVMCNGRASDERWAVPHVGDKSCPQGYCCANHYGQICTTCRKQIVGGGRWMRSGYGGSHVASRGSQCK